jgi:Rrf2 family protein
MLSASCKYGIRAAAYLANKAAEEDEFVPIRTISKDLGISFHFLTKILQTLTRDGILTSYRGPKGGVALARAAKDTTVLDIIESIDGANLFSACILGLRTCNDRTPCALHGKWTKERERLSGIFSRMTLDQLARAQGARL